MARVTIELPSGMRDRQGEWTKKVTLENMQGEEEDILADQTRVGNGKGALKRSGSDRMDEILSRCTVSLGDTDSRNEKTNRYDAPDLYRSVWHEAYSSDRIFAMIRLRQLSLSDKYRYTSTCPHCGGEHKVVVDLTELEVTNITLEEAKKTEKIFELPSGEGSITWRTFTGKDEEAIATIKKSHADQYRTLILARRIVSATFGTKDKALLMKRMSTGDRQAFGEHCDAKEGGVNIVVTHTCANVADCGKDYEGVLEVGGRSFFFPSDAKEASSSTSPSSPSNGAGVDKTSIDYLSGNVSNTTDGSSATPSE